MTVAVRIVRTFEDLRSVAGRWNALLESTSSDSVFMTWEWLYTWARHYLDERQLWVALGFKNEELIGIAPLYVSKRSLGGLTIREMRFLGSEHVGSTQLDFVVRRRHRPSFLRAVYRHLHEEAGRDWDILTLTDLPADSPSIDVWERLADETGRVLEIPGMSVAPFIDLRGGLEPFLVSLSGNERSNLRRKQRHLTELGTVAHERLSSSRDADKGLDLLIHLHQLRWSRRGAAGVFGDERRRLFHRDIARLFSEKGWLRLDFLLLNGEAIAGIYGYAYRGRYSFYLPGLNPTVAAKASPGLLLLFRCVEEAVHEGCHEFNLLQGAADYKTAWATGAHRGITLRYYNRHVRSAAVKALHSARSAIKVLVR